MHTAAVLVLETEILAEVEALAADLAAIQMLASLLN